MWHSLSLPLLWLSLALACCRLFPGVVGVSGSSGSSSGGGGSDIFRMTASVKPVPVNVGESANLTCQLELVGGQRGVYSIYWHSNVNDVGENCIPYDKEKYEILCNNADQKLATRYTLRIKKVQWSDRGIWTCKFVTNTSAVFLDVNYPTTVSTFTASPIPPPAGIGAAAAAATQPKADGTAASPYDLSTVGGGGLNFTCHSSCGYPASPLLIDYQGVNVQLPAAPRGVFTLHQSLDNASCPDDSYGLLTSARVTAVLPNCSALQLDGKARFRCSGGDQPDSYKDIYVYCPVIARDYPLTQGEIAAASVGAVLGVFLIILGFVLFCQRKPSEDLDDSASQPMQV